MKTKKYSLVLFFALCMTFLFTVKANALVKSERISGSDRYKTAVEISKSGWADGAEIAILATGENFPDALSAAPLAKKHNAPILLTEKDSLNADTEAELKRLNVKQVYIIGGSGVVSQDVENKLKSMSISVIRLSGADRYETSVKIAENLGSSSYLVIATGDDFSDALSVAPFAAANGMPIILVPKDYVPDSIKNYISGKSIIKTYVLGDTDIINEDVARQFANPFRISGSDKYQRNISIIDSFKNDIYWNTVYVATGKDFPDALAGAAAASKEKSPIVLVGDALSTEAQKLIGDNLSNISTFKVLGGEGAVPSSTVNSILSISSSQELDKGFIDGTSYKNSYFGLSLNFPDGWYVQNDAIDLSEQNAAFLLSVYRYPLDTQSFNYNFSCIAEDLSAYPEIKQSSDYMEEMIEQFKNEDFKIDKDIYSKTIDGVKFSVVDAETSAGDVVVKQRYYSTIKKGYALTFIITYVDDSNLDELNKILDSINFTD